MTSHDAVRRIKSLTDLSHQNMLSTLKYSKETKHLLILSASQSERPLHNRAPSPSQCTFSNPPPWIDRFITSKYVCDIKKYIYSKESGHLLIVSATQSERPLQDHLPSPQDKSES